MKYFKSILIFLQLWYTVESQINMASLGIASQSSTYFGYSIPLTANLAITGPPTNVFESGSCSHTSDTIYTQAWWMLSFKDTVFVTTVLIFYREGYESRLAGYYLYVGNTSSPIPSGYLCYHDVGPNLPLMNQTVKCNVLGKNLIIYQKRTTPIPSNYSKEATLELCDVQVIGHFIMWTNTRGKHCPEARWRPNHFVPVVAIDRSHEAIDRSHESQVEDNLKGEENHWPWIQFYKQKSGNMWTLEETQHTVIMDDIFRILRSPNITLQGRNVYYTFSGCMKTWYGGSCNLSCPLNCNSRHCFPENGSCIWGCNSTDNSSLFFGQYCSSICRCINQPCNQLSGLCPPGGCQRGYMGDNCSTECSAGKFGFNCNESCDGCLLNDCDKKSGNCTNTSGCKPGWQPGKPKCDIECYSYSFGKDCAGNCHCLNQTCHRISGLCPPGGCQRGYMGDNCTTECSTGTFGFNCNESCDGCLLNACNKETGTCTDTSDCKPGWQSGKPKCDIVCYSGYFGKDCSGICHCINQPCHHISGLCPTGGCQRGYMGDNCTTECSAGKFGFNCNESCDGCLLNDCNKESGICTDTSGCKPGWQPGKPKCDIECYSDSFGKDCAGICHCFNQTCHRISGLCPPGGCQRGYMGDNCTTECSEGKFGFNCNESCDGCLLNDCNKESGICTDTSGCKPGWQPGKPKCDIECYSDSFGKDCAGNCHCLNQTCHRISGLCPPGGCQRGYMGDNCTTECYSGSFGKDCAGNCHCLNQTCHHISGVCPPGGCQPGYTGDNCTTECYLGSFGKDCAGICHCLLPTCDHISGLCPLGGCQPGYFGDNCSIECSTGKFGFNCNESCDGCLLNYCVKETGICADTSGCKPGWQSGKPKCDLECYSGSYGKDCAGVCHCINQPCHHISGSCPPGGCQRGYSGDNCSTECSTGNFGFNCNESCPGCILNACDKETGVCLNTTGCNPGWEPGRPKCDIECSTGTFGFNCNESCDGCLRNACNKETGTCSDTSGCKPGWQSGKPKCDIVCYSGYFGKDCSGICHCINQTCHHISGLCPPGGCQRGYMGDNCTTECYSGSFGKDCAGICHCINQPCHHISGSCPPGGCQRGYSGDNCSTECSTGNFGFNCNESCPGCILNACDKETGFCVNTTGCNPGWEPGRPKCDIGCYSGSFGKNCAGICHCMFPTCNHISGLCPPGGCQPGYFGDNCSTECYSGSFGEHCAGKCHCLNKTCHHISGLCPPGGCQPGYMGDNCSTDCSTGKFGFNCNESCDGCLLNYCIKETGICADTSGCKPGWQSGKPKCDLECYSGLFGKDCARICHCINQPCHHISGSCPPGGCQRGYSGDNCSTECSKGNFGFNCNESCPGCILNACDKETGVCTNNTGCNPGWEPGRSKCDIECYSGSFGKDCARICHCINQPCHHISGSCPPGGCQRGYYGNNCSTECKKGNFGFNCNESCTGCILNACDKETGICTNTTGCDPGWEPGRPKCNIGVIRCIIEPLCALNGTTFNITCFDFATEFEKALFTLYIPDLETGELIQTAISLTGMFIDVLLPAGKSGNNFMYEIEVHMLAPLEGFKIVRHLEVWVLDESVLNITAIKSLAAKKIERENHALSAAIVHVVLQLNMTKTEFLEITGVLSDILSTIKTESFSVLNSVSTAVDKILEWPEALTQNTVDNLVDCLYTLSTSYANPTFPVDSREKISFTNSLFKSFSTTYDITVENSMPQDDLTVDNTMSKDLMHNNTKPYEQTNRKIYKLINVVENIADGVLNSMDNDIPERIEFKTAVMTISVGVANNSEETILNSSRQINNKILTGSFHIPILVNSSQPSFKFQMFFTEKIPFASKSKLTTPMMSLKLKDQIQMPLVDFPEPVLIRLPNDGEEKINVYTWNSQCVDGMLNSRDRFLRLYVDHPSNKFLIVKLKLQMPIPILYAINITEQVTFSDAQNGTLLTDMFTTFVKDPEENPFRWSIGLLFAESECREHVNINVSISSSAISCQYWDTEFEIWSTSGCQVSPLSTGQHILCQCSHLTHFAGGFLVLPNVIDPIADALLFLTFFDNPIIVSTVVILWMTYLFALVWARRADMKDTEFGITIPYPSNANDPYKYMMCVVTGWRFKAGTSANVSCYIIGSKGQSAKHALSVHNTVLFHSGAEDWFLITSSFDLGKLTEIVIWHDNSGSSPSWFLSRVIIQDLQSTQVYNFFNENWLGEESGKSKARLHCTSNQDLKTHIRPQFFLKASQDIRSEHLWISIFTKPKRSEFTRAQRLSCVLSLLLCTMLTCLMFHGIPEDVITQNIAGFSLQISLQDIIIGIESGIIMFPINLIIVQLFVRSERKIPKKERYLELNNFNIPATVEQRGTECKESKTSKHTTKRCPWWNLYIAWSVVILTSLTASYFVMLYGLKYGYDESLKWLLSFLTGFLDDVFVLEPLQIVLIAMIATLIFKKPLETSETPSLMVQKSNDLKTSFPLATLTNSVPRRNLKVSKHQHELEGKLQRKILDIILYILFMTVLLIVVHNHRSVNLCYHQTKAVQDLFVQKEFENIKTHEHFWTYLNASLIDRLQRVLPYDVTEKTPENDFYLLGKFRLRQVRVKRESCGFHGKLKKLFTVEFQCSSKGLPDYDTRHFNKSWDIPVDAVFTNDEWAYQSAWDLESPPYLGIKSIYSGGGYVVDLKPGIASISKLFSLSNNLWIDAQTSVVIVEFNLYNPNVNLFSNVIMSVEASYHGHFLPSYQILTTSLFRYSNPNEKAKLVLDLIFLLFTVLFTFFELKKVVQIGIKLYFKGFWNKLSMFQLVLCYTVMGFYVQHIISTEKILQIRRKKGNEIFLNFSVPILFDCITVYLMALLVAVTIIKFLKLSTLNAKLNYFYSVFMITKGTLKNFTLMFIIFFMTFVFTGNLLFGTVLEDFTSIGSSFMTLIGYTVKTVNSFDLIFEFQPVLGPIFLVLFIFAFIICFMTLYSVIIINGVKKLNASGETLTTYTPLLLTYVLDSLKHIFR